MRIGSFWNAANRPLECICENKSFDVARTAGECQSCIETHYNDSCPTKRDDHNDHDDQDDHDDHDDHNDQDDHGCGGDQDGREDIRDIMRACGFSSVSYDAAATTSVQSINVSATKPTDIGQLTTTVNPQETGIFGVGDAANTDTNNDDTTDDDSAAAQGALPGMVLYVAGAVVAGAFMLQ
ncbi:hypothetical protein IMZ48_28865 [Candidatus Bathyarchaeota archaeon]|nr:hypothetical protein [Candidatus Bathyarchaeota archaeon]